MLIYFLIIFFLYFNSFVNFGRYTKHIYWFWVGCLAVISGIRYCVGTDFQVQINYYNWTLAGKTSGWLEPGFRMYIRLIDHIFGDFQMFIGIAAVFVVFSFGYLIYNYIESKYWFLGLSIFVTSTIYFATMNLERQYIAIAFLALSISFLEKQKFIWTGILFLLAVSFHQSAICFLVYYIFYIWLNWKNGEYYLKRMKIVNIFFIVSVIGIVVDFRKVLALVGNKILPERYAGYLNSQFFLNKDMSSILKFIFPDLIWFLLFWKFSKSISGRNARIFLPGYFLWIFINNFFYGINVMLRIGMYFEWMLIFIFPHIVQSFKSGRTRTLFKIVFLVYFLSLTCYSIFYVGGHGVVPYQTFIDWGK